MLILMNLIEIIGIAVGLAMDAFAVSIACSISIMNVTPRQIFRFSFHFGLFQGMMPVLGWLAGRAAYSYISSWDHWLAFALLSYVGIKAIYEAFKEKDIDVDKKDPTRGISLVIFSIATSIDALAVGLSLAAINVVIWYPALIIGIITASLTIIGMLLGSKIGSGFGKKVEISGGLILIGIGFKILISHL